MRNEVLTINGAMAEYSVPDKVIEPLDNGAKTTALQMRERLANSERTVQFLPEMGARRDFGPVVVPKEQYFFLGDNRDNSADSRYIGFVPRHLLIGKAHHILASAAIKGDWLPRLERTAHRIE